MKNIDLNTATTSDFEILLGAELSEAPLTAKLAEYLKDKSNGLILPEHVALHRHSGDCEDVGVFLTVTLGSTEVEDQLMHRICLASDKYDEEYAEFYGRNYSVIDSLRPDGSTFSIFVEDYDAEYAGVSRVEGLINALDALVTRVKKAPNSKLTEFTKLMHSIAKPDADKDIVLSEIKAVIESSVLSDTSKLHGISADMDKAFHLTIKMLAETHSDDIELNVLEFAENTAGVGVRGFGSQYSILVRRENATTQTTTDNAAVCGGTFEFTVSAYYLYILDCML